MKEYFFQAGGTLGEDAPSYIERDADTTLLNYLERGEVCLVLAPRQVGKSSLMVRTMAKLRKAGVNAGIVDLQPLGSSREQVSWFSDVVFQIGRSLCLRTDAAEWWEKNRGVITTWGSKLAKTIRHKFCSPRQDAGGANY